MSDEYPYLTPRWLHKPYGETLKVETAEDCQAALESGWMLKPPVWPPEPKPVEPSPPKRRGRVT